MNLYMTQIQIAQEFNTFFPEVAFKTAENIKHQLKIVA